MRISRPFAKELRKQETKPFDCCDKFGKFDLSSIARSRTAIYHLCEKAAHVQRVSRRNSCDSTNENVARSISSVALPLLHFDSPQFVSYFVVLDTGTSHVYR